MPSTPAGSWPIVARESQTAAVLGALAERPTRLQLLEGAAGSGKSALAARIGELLMPRRPVTVTGLAARAATPLGALDDLLGGLSAAVEPGSALHAAVVELGREPERTVLVVDDAPRLDEVSAEVVRRLVRGFGVPVIASARTGEQLPAALRRLDDEGLVQRHVLEGLSVAETAALLEARFRVPALAEDVSRLVWETAGSPLHLRIIVESAIEAGEVRHRGDAVQFERRDPPSDLGGLLDARLSGLSEEARRLLRVVALTQPVPRSRVVVSPERDDALEELIRRGMVLADEGADRLSVAHPLIAEALGEEPVAVDEALRLLRAGGDPPQRFAAVELERRADRETAASELVWAASYASARGDHRAAADLADVAVRRPARRSDVFTAQLAAAVYRSLAGELDEADRLFALAGALASEAGELAALASGRGEHLSSRRDDPVAAVDQGQLVRASLTAREAVALDADLWRWRVLAERGAGAGAVAEREIRAAVAAVVSASMRGEPSAALAAVAPLTTPAVALGPLASDAAIALGLQRLVALRAGGPAERVAEFLEAGRAQAGDEVGFFTLMLGAHRAQEGRLGEALPIAELAVEQLRRNDAGELLALALALRATVNAQRGAVADARAQLSELEALAVSGAAVLQRAQCEAFLLAAEGDLGAAAAVIHAVVSDAATSGYRFLGALTLSDAIRFGEVERTATLADQLCDGMAEQAEPCSAVRDLAVALRLRQLDLVGPAARRLARAGLGPAAVDGLALALGMTADEHVRRRLHADAVALSAGIDAPLLQRIGLPSLTSRELEVAQAAAQRMRAREIAERMGISARTVENQLYSVYRKLGVASRDELRDALREVGRLAVD